MLLLACSRGPRPCACPNDIRGHGVVLDDQCSCLPIPDLGAEHLPVPSVTFHVDADADGGDGSATSPWDRPDWSVIDIALAKGPVEVRFDAGDTFPDRLEVLRTDTGPHRLTLVGREGGARARVPGVHTTYELVPRHRVTVTGFEITGSRDKGIYWAAGDDVVLHDNVIHDNRGSPSINLDYSSRTGLPSRGLRIIGNHVYDQIGECIYVGGSEGLDEDSHADVEISFNLVHGCHHPTSTRHDGINVKDRLTDVVVRRNVVIDADWCIEVASAGVYTGNLAVDCGREGFHVSDGFQALPDMRFVDNTAIRSGDEGFQLTANRAPTGTISVEGLTVIDAGQHGVAVGGEHDVTAVFEGVVVQGAPVALDGWGQGSVQVNGCVTADVGADFDRLFDGQAPCDTGAAVDAVPLAGPDGLFFTADDGWLVEGGATL